MNIGRAVTPRGVSYGLVTAGEFEPIVGTPFEAVEVDGSSYPLSDVTLLAPIDPGRVLVILWGFVPEGEEVPSEPGEPRLFPKMVHRHSGPDATLPWHPQVTGELRYEAELALVVGRHVRDVDAATAWESILGFTVYNDVTAAEYIAAGDHYRAKSLDGFGALGPWITTDLSRERLRGGLTIEGRLNGEVVQHESTARYKAQPEEVLSYASRYFTMRPGDVIALGTPPPPPGVLPGDEFEAEVEGVGLLRTICGGPAPTG